MGGWVGWADMIEVGCADVIEVDCSFQYVPDNLLGERTLTSFRTTTVVT